MVQCPPPRLPPPPSKKNWNGATLERCYKPSISPFYLLSVLYAYFLDTLTGFLMLTVVPRKRGGSVLVATQTSLIFLDLKVRILSSFTFRKSPHFSHRSRDWKNPWEKSGSQGLKKIKWNVYIAWMLLLPKGWRTYRRNPFHGEG